MGNVQKIPVVVSDIINHGDHVYTVRFSSERRIPRFKPGQFLHLALDNFDPSTGFWPESRVFSIAASPSPNEVMIAYSAKGTYTARMERELSVGNTVWVKLPYGSFIIEEYVGNDGPAILVAGGTGFTPFVSFLEREVKNRSSRQIWLFYGVRNPSLLLFLSVLSSAQVACSGFNLSLKVEDGRACAALYSVEGRLSADEVIDAHRALERAPIFLAGPPLMLGTFKKSFSTAGIAEKQIIIDEWK